ncbi:MAG: TolC family outer membrane protein [Pseudomonadota bacterium]
MKKMRGLLVGLLMVWVQGVWAQDLMAVYELAVKSDPQLQASAEQLNAARETKNLSRSQLLPTIGLGASYNYIHSEGDDTTSKYSDRNLGLSLTQPIYRRNFLVQLEQTDSTIAQAEAQYAAAEIDLMVRSATTYFNILSAQDDLKVAQSEREATGRQLDQAQQRFDVGLIAITDVHEAQAAYDAARASEIAADNSLDNAWEALFEIIGPESKTKLAKLGEGLQLAPPVPNDLQQWSDTAQQQNFDIIATRSSLDSVRQEIEVSRSGHYPTLDLVGGYNLSRTDNEFGSEADTATIGLDLAIPLYAGGAVSSQTKQARANYRAAQQGLDQTRRAVNRQVRDAFRGVLSTISRVEALQAATVSAKSALESTQAGYEVGTRTIVDVLNVQRNLFSSQRDYLSSRYDYIINGFSLKAAAGNLGVEDLQRANSWLEQ